MPAAESLPFGPGALIVVGLYVLSLLAVGALAYARRRENSLNDFFLGGRTLGLGVLLLTLYATQYSGNTLLGFSGAAYREGFSFLVSVHFMTAIIIAYLIFAPRLYRLSREHGYITPGDYIQHRFGSAWLRGLVTLLMVYALCNFTLAQMKTLGTAFETVSQGRIPMWAGVVALVGVMLVYETLGGMRSVAWTDAIQGGILLGGFAILLTLALTQIGSLPDAVTNLAAHPDTAPKVSAPDADGVRRWISFVLLVGLGAAIYPQALQRIYAARSARTLKRSLAVMAFLPLTTALVAVLVGILMAAHLPGLDRQMLPDGTTGAIVPTETVLPLLCLEVMQSSAFGYGLVVILFAALLAAVMSTADSAILSLSSMITQDLYRPLFRPDADQASLTRVGKGVTWALMVPLTLIALTYEGTLIDLLQIKFELLIQCVPAFYLGVHSKRLSARTVMLGIGTGLATTLGLTWAGDLGLAAANHPTVAGLHAGLIGLAVNLGVCSLDFLPGNGK